MWQRTQDTNKTLCKVENLWILQLGCTGLPEMALCWRSCSVILRAFFNTQAESFIKSVHMDAVQVSKSAWLCPCELIPLLSSCCSFCSNGLGQSMRLWAGTHCFLLSLSSGTERSYRTVPANISTRPCQLFTRLLFAAVLSGISAWQGLCSP